MNICLLHNQVMQNISLKYIYILGIVLDDKKY